VTDEEFSALLAAWFGNASRVLRPGGGFYVWGGYANFANYPSALRDAGLYFSRLDPSSALWEWRPRTDSNTHQQRSVLDWYLEVG
jgi:hypothetical protein